MILSPLEHHNVSLSLNPERALLEVLFVQPLVAHRGRLQEPEATHRGRTIHSGSRDQIHRRDL